MLQSVRSFLQRVKEQSMWPKQVWEEHVDRFSLAGDIWSHAVDTPRFECAALHIWYGRRNQQKWWRCRMLVICASFGVIGWPIQSNTCVSKSCAKLSQKQDQVALNALTTETKLSTQSLPNTSKNNVHCVLKLYHSLPPTKSIYPSPTLKSHISAKPPWNTEKTKSTVHMSHLLRTIETSGPHDVSEEPK